MWWAFAGELTGIIVAANMLTPGDQVSPERMTEIRATRAAIEAHDNK
jgi:hypothetical protein